MNFFEFFLSEWIVLLRIRIRIRTWIRIQIGLKSWIRIQIQCIWIHNTGLYDTNYNNNTVRPGLYHAVDYRCEWEAEWLQLDTSSIPRNLTELSLPLPGLTHPYANYTLRLRLLSGSANRADQRLWSEVLSVSQLTLPSRPFR